jgi:hypothetical protein
MQRREFMVLVGAGAMAGLRPAAAQTPDRIYRLGTLHPTQLLSATNRSARS